ncbi:hypothetical protein BDK51DRAFT_34154 [Blyttiomyces helicus]|uniref:Uncharacterized protein n=1 Tax=Blyttiomyces helicus TaxID=388810 RepID=A0A4V1IRX6_9FUNG|nr:hypothetical protein BDK51DRAFT_34154 [Blyttiomyces helicus]|eukprot:RKO91587.1 hypothetical protein BDK51DRAFT_34154 [Blyttiomyces helicus]
MASGWVNAKRAGTTFLISSCSVLRVVETKKEWGQQAAGGEVLGLVVGNVCGLIMLSDKVDFDEDSSNWGLADNTLGGGASIREDRSAAANRMKTRKEWGEWGKEMKIMVFLPLVITTCQLTRNLSSANAKRWNQPPFWQVLEIWDQFELVTVMEACSSMRLHKQYRWGVDAGNLAWPKTLLDDVQAGFIWGVGGGIGRALWVNGKPQIAPFHQLGELQKISTKAD